MHIDRGLAILKRAGRSDDGVQVPVHERGPREQRDHTTEREERAERDRGLTPLG